MEKENNTTALHLERNQPDPTLLENEPLSAHPRHFPLTGTAFTAGAVRLFITFDFEDVRKTISALLGVPVRGSCRTFNTDVRLKVCMIHRT